MFILHLYLIYNLYLKEAKMSINEDWDVEQYKMECESNEHWELKRKFLLTHKDKYPEDTLVCLAQVFINIELLGCRYPKQTMDLIKELSQDVAAEYREKQKKKLQRTFVEASQAASSKIKGYINRTSIVTEKYAPNCSKYISSTTKQIDSYCKTVDTKKLSCNRMEKSVSKKNKFDKQFDIKELKFKKSKTNDVMSYEDIILWERPGDTSQNILSTSANICNANLEWKYKKEEIWECTIYFNSNKLACCINSNKKVAKSNAADTALKKLQQSYYTIKVKPNLDANVTVTTQEIKQTNDEGGQKFNCIGEKMMKMMGWMGGGLGKSEQGVTKPMSMTLQSQVSRKGFGLVKTDSCTAYKVKTKCENVFKDFLESNMQNDIVFLDFTNDERVMIHQMARRMGLKSRSYGPAHQRKLIVSRKINIQNLLNELKNLGGVTEKYELIEPTDKKLISSCSIASTSNSI